MDGAKYSMKEESRVISGAYRKAERKKSQQANYIAAHQGQTVQMVSGIMNVNYQLDGQKTRPHHSQVVMDEFENGSLSYSASSTGESTDSSFADSLRMNEIYDPANLQLSAAAYEMLFKSKSSQLSSGRSFTRDSSFASDSLGYSTDGDSFCGYADYSNVAMSRSGQPTNISSNNKNNNLIDHKQNVTVSSVSNNKTRAQGRGKTVGGMNEFTTVAAAVDKMSRQSTIESNITRSPSNSSTRTPPNAFSISSRNISSSSPATLVTSDVSLSSTGTPPPPRRKTDRDIRSNKTLNNYDNSCAIPVEIRGTSAGGNSHSLSYARWWMCGFTDAFNFNSS